MSESSLSALYLSNPQLAIALRRQLEGAAQMRQGTGGEPIRSPWQGANNLANALIGGWQAGKGDEEIKSQGEASAAEEADIKRAIAGALAGQGQRGQPMQNPGGMSPAPTMGAPMGGGGSYADRVIGAESGGNPTARNPLSSATGAGQFIDSTWLAMMRDHPAAQGKSQPEVLAMRNDPALSREMVDKYAQQNAQHLAAQGLPANDATQYLAHWFGPVGATQILKAPPGTPMSQVMPPEVLRANPTIAGLTTDGVLATVQRKMGSSQQMASLPPATTDAGSGPAPMPPQAAPQPGMAAPPQAPPQAAPMPVPPIPPGDGPAGSGRDQSALMQIYMRGMMSNNPRVQRIAQGLAPFIKQDEEIRILAPGAMAIDRSGRMLFQNTNDPAQVRIDQRPASTYSDHVAKGLGERDIAAIDSARDAPERIDTSRRIRALIDSGAITGPAAAAKLALAKGMNLLGATPDESISRTQTLVSELARVTQEHIKSSGLGGGSGFSNADRDFLERARAGQIEYTPDALKYLAELNERSARMAITQGNTALGRVRKIPSLTQYFADQPDFTDAMPSQSGRPPGASGPVPPGPPVAAPSTPAPSQAAPQAPPLVATPADAARLPPGTIFRTPDGRTLRVPMQQAPR